MHTDGSEADTFGCGADAEQAHAAAPDEALLAQGFQRIVPAVVFGNHPQARWPAVHRVKLVVVGERMGHGKCL